MIINDDIDNKSILLLSILGFLFVLLSLLIIIITPSTSGYEISIYSIYPIFLWGFLIISIFIGQIIIYKGLSANNKLWPLGILLITFVNIILLTMPIIRGYEIYGRDDVLSHLGFIRDILFTGSIGDNTYPMDHILAAIITYFSSFRFTINSSLVPAIFSLFFITSFYLLLKKVYQDKKLISIALMFSTVLIMSSYQMLFSPYPQSIFFIPFVLYLYFNSRDSKLKLEFTLILILILIVLVFYHPLTSLILILILLSLQVAIYIEKLYHRYDFKFIKNHILILITLVIFFMWGTYAYVFLKSLQQIALSLIGEARKSELQTYSDILSHGSPDLLNLLNTIFHIYGQFILLSILALISVIYLIKYRKTNKLNFYLSFFTLSFACFSICTLTTFISTFLFNFSRLLPLIAIFSILLIPIAINKMKNSNNVIKKLNLVLIGGLIVFIVYFSIFNIYNDPITKTAGQQVSKHEIIGMESFFNIRDSNYYISEFGISQVRFYDFFYGPTRKPKNIRVSTSANLPDHFGYNSSSTLGSYFKKPEYILLNKYALEFYPFLYPEFKDKWRYNQDDFENLDKDNSLSKIYENGELKTYFITNI